MVALLAADQIRGEQSIGEEGLWTAQVPAASGAAVSAPMRASRRRISH